MTGRKVGTKLGEKSKKFNSNTSKIIRYLQARPGQLISQTDLLNNLDISNDSCFNTAYHNGYVLRVKRDEQYFYFYPTEEDCKELKKEFKNTLDEQNPENYDLEKQNQLLDNSAKKYSKKTVTPSQRPSGKAGNQGISSLKQQIDNVESEIQTLEETNKMLQSVLNSCNDSQESFHFKKKIDDNDKTIGVKTGVLKNLKAYLKQLEQLPTPA